MLAVGLGLLLAGCSTDYYRKSADKQVYGLIQQAERQLFGRTNDFSIATRYSDIKPADLMPLEIIESRMMTNWQLVNMEQSMALAIQNSREYQSAKDQLYIAALNLTGTSHEFSPNFFATINPEVRGSTDGGVAATTMKSQVGFSQLLKTGGDLSVALGNDLLRYYTGSGGASDVLNTLSVSLAQPLLRGFGSKNAAVENLTQAQRNVIYAVRTFAQYQRQFAVDLAGDYFSLLAQKANVRNNYTNFLRRVETVQYNEARAVDRVRRSEVDDARQSELQARIQYVNSLATYLNQLNAFKLRLGTPVQQPLFLDDSDLRTLEAAGLVGVPIGTDAAFRLTVEKQMEILNAIDKFEDSKRKLAVAADQLRPGLNLYGRLNFNTDDDNQDYARFDPKNWTYTAGVNIDLPIDRVKERNNYRTALISFESQIRSLSLTLDNYADRISRGLRTITQTRLNHVSRQAALVVAQRRVENTQLLLEAGRAQVRDLRDAQDSLVAAENSLTDNLVAYLEARMQLLTSIGVMVTDTPQFWLNDPIAAFATGAPPGTALLELPQDEIAPPNQFLEPAQ